MTTPPFTGRTISCPLCNSNDLTCVGMKDRHGGHLKTDLCRQCGHVFTNPQPTQVELDAYYGTRYRSSYKGVATPKQKHVYRAGLRAGERLARLTPFVHPGDRVLDVGSGGGEFVYLLSQRGFEAHGLEPNEGYATFAKTEYGIPITVGTVENMGASDQYWKAITLHHVLEHLSDPIATLKQLATLLAEDGVMIVEVPNVLARYHGPKRRFHFAHLHTFSADGLTRAAQCAGLTVSSLQIEPHTGHLNVALERGEQVLPEFDRGTAAHIEDHIKQDTPMRDVVSTRPYKRLWANLKRPLKERIALRRLGKPTSAKRLLDRLYAQTAPT